MPPLGGKTVTLIGIYAYYLVYEQEQTHAAAAQVTDCKLQINKNYTQFFLHELSHFYRHMGMSRRNQRSAENDHVRILFINHV